MPKQHHIRNASGVGVCVDGDELHKLNVWLSGTGLRILAQIHSHPTNAYHSTTDDDFAIATAAGSLSLVIPDFASQPFDLKRTAVYRLNTRGEWFEVKSSEVSRLISVVD